MGSNIHFHDKGNSEPIPEGLAPLGDATCYRSTEDRDIVYAIWEGCESILICGCDPEDHDYFCDRNAIVRPNDFATLRAKLKEQNKLSQRAETILDYMEHNPDIWLEYN